MGSKFLTADLGCIADGKHLNICPFLSHSHYLAPPSLHPAFFCGEQGCLQLSNCSKTESNELRTGYHQLIPNSQLDIAMVTDWERTDMNAVFEASADSEEQQQSQSLVS